jgi:hypothetical protein
VILAELEAQFGGAAAAMNKVGEGTTRLKNAWNDLKQTIGAAIENTYRVQGVAGGIAQKIEAINKASTPDDYTREYNELVAKLESETKRAAEERKKIENRANAGILNDFVSMIGEKAAAMKSDLAMVAENANKMQAIWEKTEAARLKDVEETSKKLEDLESERISHLRRQEMERARANEQEAAQRVADAAAENAKTIAQMIAEAKELKAAGKVREDEGERADKLRAKEKRGIRLSKRDREFLDMFERRDVAAQNLPGFEGELKNAQDQMRLLENNNRTLGLIEKEIRENNTKLNSLLRMG